MDSAPTYLAAIFLNPHKQIFKRIKNLASKQTKKLRALTLEKEINKIQTNGIIYHIHGLEELTSLKCPYYLKLFIDSTQSLLEY